MCAFERSEKGMEFNMTDVEVALANLGEIAKKGGHVAKVAREDMERELGQSVVSKENVLNYKYINENKLTKKNQISEKK